MHEKLVQNDWDYRPCRGNQSLNDGLRRRGGGGEPKSITITGISGLSGVVEVFIDDGNDRVIAGNKNGTISSGSVTVELFTSVDSDGSDFTTTAYTGSGSYYVWIGAGQNWYHTSQKISITEATTTIPFAQFTTM